MALWHHAPENATARLDSRPPSSHAHHVDPAIRALLESADDPIHAEDDQKVEWEEMNERVSGLLPKLERITGQTFDLDDGVQDATYWGELAIWRSSADTPEWGEVLEAVFAVRFSNFGWLFTAWGRHPTERLPEAQVEEVIPRPSPTPASSTSRPRRSTSHIRDLTRHSPVPRGGTGSSTTCRPQPSEDPRPRAGRSPSRRPGCADKLR